MRLIDADELKSKFSNSPLGYLSDKMVREYIDTTPTVDAKTILNYIYGRESLGHGGIVFELDDTPEEIFKEQWFLHPNLYRNDEEGDKK